MENPQADMVAERKRRHDMEVLQKAVGESPDDAAALRRTMNMCRSAIYR